MLYQASDLKDNGKQIKRRVLLMAALALGPVAGGVVVMYTIRWEWLSILLGVLGLSIGIFFYGLFISPLASYRRYLNDVLNGASHVFYGPLTREEAESQREGVLCRTLYFLDEGDGEERLCYLDQAKPLPLEVGQRYQVTVHGQSILAAEPV